MLKKAAIVVLLGILGLVVGYASTWLGGHYYYVGTKLWLARDTPYTSHELMAMTRGHHPGAVVWADGSAVDIMATGSIDGAEHAVREAFEKVVVANDRKFQFLPYDAHFADQMGLTWGNPVHRGLIGLLAGISVALGFLVPPRSRAARCPSCSRIVRPARPKRGAAMPIALGIVGGFATASLILVLAAFAYAMYSRQYAPITGGL